jgi:hypothetical protein
MDIVNGAFKPDFHPKQLGCWKTELISVVLEETCSSTTRKCAHFELDANYIIEGSLGHDVFRQQRAIGCNGWAQLCAHLDIDIKANIHPNKRSCFD